MYDITYTMLSPIEMLRKRRGLSERSFAALAGLSHINVRNLERKSQANMTIKSLARAAEALEHEVYIMVVPSDSSSRYSTVAVSLKVQSDGFNSWKGHFMELVDEFRRTLDPRLLLLAPIDSLAPELVALMASIVQDLSLESNIDPPGWATKNYFLETPWFPSQMESLKATALVSSPLCYRRNNIFVQDNFLKRV